MKTTLKSMNKAGYIGLILAFLGILMIVFGVFRGEMKVVLAKAIKICLECIGIG